MKRNEFKERVFALSVSIEHQQIIYINKTCPCKSVTLIVRGSERGRDPGCHVSCAGHFNIGNDDFRLCSCRFRVLLYIERDVNEK